MAKGRASHPISHPFTLHPHYQFASICWPSTKICVCQWEHFPEVPRLNTQSKRRTCTFSNHLEPFGHGQHLDFDIVFTICCHVMMGKNISRSEFPTFMNLSGSISSIGDPCPTRISKWSSHLKTNRILPRTINMFIFVTIALLEQTNSMLYSSLNANKQTLDIWSWSNSGLLYRIYYMVLSFILVDVCLVVSSFSHLLLLRSKYRRPALLVQTETLISKPRGSQQDIQSEIQIWHICACCFRGLSVALIFFYWTPRDVCRPRWSTQTIERHDLRVDDQVWCWDCKVHRVLLSTMRCHGGLPWIDRRRQLHRCKLAQRDQ